MVRFQKRIKLGKGFNLNISKSGLGYSIGPPGLKLSAGPRGAFFTTGIPGSGISHRGKIGSTGSNRKSKEDYSNLISQLVFKVDDQGQLLVTDSSGNIIDENLIKKLKRTEEYKEKVAQLYDQTISTYKEESQQFLEIYKFVPEIKNEKDWETVLSNLQNVEYVQDFFDVQQPKIEEIENQLAKEAESIKSVFFWKTESLRKEFIEKNKLNRYNQLLKDWNEKKAAFDSQEMKRKEEIENKNKLNVAMKQEIIHKILPGDSAYINSEIEQMLEKLKLPVEFFVDFNYSNEGKLFIDLDLPEIEDIPNKKAGLLKSGKLKIEEKRVKEINEDYAKCITGLAFFLAGNFFNISPKIEEIQISGYTQRLSKKSGNIEDQYVYSIRFNRSTFEQLDFDNIDPVTAFNNFESVIKCNSKFEIKEIKPF